MFTKRGSTVVAEPYTVKTVLQCETTQVRPVLMVFVFLISLPHQNMLPPQFDHYCIIMPLLAISPQQVLMITQDVSVFAFSIIHDNEYSV